MNRIDAINRIENLEKKIEELREKERELDIVRYNCKHDIVVVVETWGCYLVGAKCLICGKRFNDSRSLRDVRKIINMSKYSDDNDLFATDKYMLVKEKYIDIVTKNPDLSDEEIVELIKKELKL